MSVLIGHNVGSLSPLAQVLLSILEGLLAEDGDALVEVLHREDDSRATRQGVHFRAAVPQPRQELLHEAHLVDNIKVAKLVDVLEHRRCELLLRMDELLH